MIHLNEKENDIYEYLNIIEKDLLKLKSNRTDTIEYQIKDNLELLCYEIDYFTLEIDNSEKSKIESGKKTLKIFNEKYKKLKKEFDTFSKIKIKIETDNIVTLDKIIDISKKINIFDLESLLKRRTINRFRR